MTHAGLFLEIDGLAGDSRTPGFEGWMDVCWFSFGGAGTFGQTRPGTLASITMPVSRVSTKLQMACLNKERFAEATLVARDATRGDEVIRGRMKNVRVSEFQVRGYSGDMPIHSLELTFETLVVRDGPNKAAPAEPVRVVAARAKATAPARRPAGSPPRPATRVRVRTAK
jgi:type VI protein secretion system component Hcp